MDDLDAAYLPDDGSTEYRGYGIMALTIADGQVASITGFADPALFPVFGLPLTHRPSHAVHSSSGIPLGIRNSR